jgi:large subunit ribosomal protein L35Ae
MEGIIINFRKSMHTVSENQMVVKVTGVETKEAAAKLVGKKVTYNTGKKDMVGQVTATHGNSGALRVKFETGMPGQSICQKVTVN